MTLSARDLSDLQRLLEQSSHDALGIEAGGQRVTLKRAEGCLTYEVETFAEPSLIGGHGAEAEEEAAAAAEADQRAAEQGLLVVRAPLPGTFYRAPKPGADPFVEVGATVGEHTVIGIIETMKLMNSIPAGVTGEIVEICAENGGFVETGHGLVHVRPSGGGA